MKPIKYILISVLFLLTGGCIKQFIPQTDENKELLVVDGMVTDQNESYKIRLSMSSPLGTKITATPVTGCTVIITDDLGNSYGLTEKYPGVYVTDSTTFRGQTGRKYKLIIHSNNAELNNYTFESVPAEMQTVPAIDSLYYEKVTIKQEDLYSGPKEGCQIYLNTNDPLGNCKYYRWDFTETWEFIIPYYVPNRICWITNKSDAIEIRNTSILEKDSINRMPVKFISNETDRLNVKYSILVNQYSMNEDEYLYWEKLQNVTQNVGGLYDIVPSTIAGNMFCVENPAEEVVGYFSVSAKNSKRIYIKDRFSGLINLYSNCAKDTIFGNAETPIPGLNFTVWVIDDESYSRPPYRIITDKKGCADCTVRGSTRKPDFWVDDN